MLNLFNVLDACAGVIGENGVPDQLVHILHYAYLAIQVIIPILLIIFGMIDLGKAITQSKEDEIKKAQSAFLKKLIIAVIVFLVFTIVNFIFNFAAGNDENTNNSIWNCIDALINGKTS